MPCTCTAGPSLRQADSGWGDNQVGWERGGFRCWLRLPAGLSLARRAAAAGRDGGSREDSYRAARRAVAGWRLGGVPAATGGGGRGGEAGVGGRSAAAATASGPSRRSHEGRGEPGTRIFFPDEDSRG